MGLQLIKPDTNIDFIGFRKIAYIISIVVILIGLGSMLLKGGPRYGIDFAGGIIVQVKFKQPVDVDTIKGSLSDLDLPGLTIQSFGTGDDHEVLIRTSSSEVDSSVVRDLVNDSFNKGLGGVQFEIQRLEMVGPKVGADLRGKALEAMFYAVLLIAIYISGRFEQRWFTALFMAGGLAAGLYLLGLTGMSIGYLTIAAGIITLFLCWYLKLNYALGAVVALVHDVLITVGVFSLLDKEFDLTVIAALLTIIGYSLNDTIIVFDRIRENYKGSKSQLAETINTSINQTLSRTLLTSGTTLIVVLCLYFLGGGVIHDFALALLVGIVVGTYSSIYVASPILLGFGPMPPAEEGAGKQAQTTA